MRHPERRDPASVSKLAHFRRSHLLDYFVRSLALLGMTGTVALFAEFLNY